MQWEAEPHSTLATAPGPPLTQLNHTNRDPQDWMGSESRAGTSCYSPRGSSPGGDDDDDDDGVGDDDGAVDVEPSSSRGARGWRTPPGAAAWRSTVSPVAAVAGGGGGVSPCGVSGGAAGVSPKAVAAAGTAQRHVQALAGKLQVRSAGVCLCGACDCCIAYSCQSLLLSTPLLSTLSYLRLPS